MMLPVGTRLQSRHHGGMPTVLLVLPSASYRAPDFVAAARALGVNLMVASEGNQSFPDPERLVKIDLRRPDWSIDEIATSTGSVDAVMAVDDASVVIAAGAAARLGLNHNSPEAVAATRDKSELRRLLLDAGVSQPEFRVTDVASAADLADEIGYPVVVKPVSLSASRGVIRADDRDAAAEAALRCRAILDDAGKSESEPMLIERYIPGDEIAVEGMLKDGAVEILAILDKPDPLVGPFFEETMFVTPSRHSEAAQAAIADVVTAATKAIGLVEGPIHAELRLDGDQPYMLEIAARPIGGLCSRALSFGVFGASLETVLLRNALRLPQGGLDPLAPAAGVMMLPIPRRGRRGAVTGREDALRVPGITGLEITVAEGALVVPLPEGERYLGFLFSRGTTPADAEASLRQAYSLLDIAVEER